MVLEKLRSESIIILVNEENYSERRIFRLGRGISHLL
jgi:Zn-dependent peptidase ImmA (M78 family)